MIDFFKGVGAARPPAQKSQQYTTKHQHQIDLLRATYLRPLQAHT